VNHIFSYVNCQRPESRPRLKPETMIVTFEEFSLTGDFFDYKSSYVIDCTVGWGIGESQGVKIRMFSHRNLSTE
jgi:hypothetical protein